MTTGRDNLLVINSGSSSLKFTLFTGVDRSSLQERCRGLMSGIGQESRFRVSENGRTREVPVVLQDHEQALSTLMTWLSEQAGDATLTAVGHRMVHGGTRFNKPVPVTNDVLHYLDTLTPLAPNHLPANLAGIAALQKLQPNLPQVACFDTAFHSTRAEVEQQFALPDREALNNVRRYGFHGLSYEYIASVLPDHLGEKADGRVIVAHLGHGASLCAMHQRHSVATTMTFTPLDGIPMGTRSGSIDPAVVLYLLQQGMTSQAISDLLYFESGLLGVSGISDDMSTLLDSNEAKARFAIDLFVHHTVRAIGSLAAALGGIDGLVFTAGIGEHSPRIRSAVAAGCKWLGLELDEAANTRGISCINKPGSQVEARVIPTNEELMIARHTLATLSLQAGN
ncbi:acetate kinase [Thiogranum longum]|uniref:Acetate kinase n=1 Tax=Thiogranum longum TaxID=1537524 RepID=A0A4R1HB53_9GAMM|nr:acetate/propionate family kinase [Thiogranum longum]TCK17743.1 acetate kinase [Thiogranum longum]